MHSFYPELQPLQPSCRALVTSWLLLLSTLREQSLILQISQNSASVATLLAF